MRIDNLLLRILSLRRLQNAESLVVALLIELYVPQDYDGFEHLRRAVLLYRKDPTQGLSQGLYRAVAEQYDRGVTAPQIEQAIRRAIRAAWKYSSEKEWKLYFPNQSLKPSNGCFIAQLARLVDLWEGCSVSERGIAL